MPNLGNERYFDVVFIFYQRLTAIFQAKLKHDLAETEKELANNSRMIDDLNDKHDALVLEDVE